MRNTQVTHSASVNNARSESFLVIDPNNPLRMVAASKKFNNIQTYDFTLATAYSADGGNTWRESAALPMAGFTMLTDPAMAWDDAGNVFLVGLSGVNPPRFQTIGIVIYKSTDAGATWSAPKTIHTSSADDKQWAAGDGNPASPFHGNVYAAWDDGAGLAFARTTDHGATWKGAGTTAAGSIISTGSVYPEVNVSQDGTVYIVTITGNQIRMIASTDGGNSFHTVSPPASGIITLESYLTHVGGWPVLPGGTFRVISDPTACTVGRTVLVAWADHREPVSRIYYARSVDGGNTWTTGPSGRPLLPTGVSPSLHHFHPQIVANSRGVVACTLYEFGPKPSTPLIDVVLALSFDAGLTFRPLTVTDRPWDPAVDAPWVHGDRNVTFIGDYMGLDISPIGIYPLWTDTRTGIQELWAAGVPVWQPVGRPAGGVLGAPVAAANADGRLELFAVAADGALQHAWQTAPGGQWSDWSRIAPAVTLSSGPPVTAVNLDGRLEVFGTQSGGRPWHVWQAAPNDGWSAGEPLGQPGVPIIGRTAAGRNEDGRLEVFGVGSDRLLHHAWQQAPNSGWSGWASLGAPPPGITIGDPRIMSNADGRLEVFLLAADGQIWHVWQTARNNGWSGWASMGRPPAQVANGAPFVGRNADGRLEAFATGADGAIYHCWQTARNNGWSGWTALGRPATTQVYGMGSVANSGNGSLEVFAVGTDGGLWTVGQSAPNNGWGSWRYLDGAPPGQTLNGNQIPALARNVSGELAAFLLGPDGDVWYLARTVSGGPWGPKG